MWAHTRVSLRKLATRCPKRVDSVAMQRALDRMKLGKHPSEDLFWGQPSTFAVFSHVLSCGEWVVIPINSVCFSAALLRPL